MKHSSNADEKPIFTCENYLTGAVLKVRSGSPFTFVMAFGGQRCPGNDWMELFWFRTRIL